MMDMAEKTPWFWLYFKVLQSVSDSVKIFELCGLQDQGCIEEHCVYSDTGENCAIIKISERKKNLCLHLECRVACSWPG